MGKRKPRREKPRRQLKLALDEEHFVPKKMGGGKLSMRAWTDNKDRVVRYSMAYINHTIYTEDNGRVLGYDDSHNHHHRHYYGKIETVEFISFKDTLEKFEKEWWKIANEHIS